VVIAEVVASGRVSSSRSSPKGAHSPFDPASLWGPRESPSRLGRHAARSQARVNLSKNSTVRCDVLCWSRTAPRSQSSDSHRKIRSDPSSSRTGTQWPASSPAAT
jgi:hypothetical protein